MAQSVQKTALRNYFEACSQNNFCVSKVIQVMLLAFFEVKEKGNVIFEVKNLSKK